MVQKCENCGKIYPKLGRWYESIGVKRGGGAVSPEGDFPEPPSLKLCGNCFDKLSDQEKNRWRFLLESFENRR